jgi:hypothetical protein
MYAKNSRPHRPNRKYKDSVDDDVDGVGDDELHLLVLDLSGLNIQIKL